jgi:pantoate--beta-alanine ligase
MEVIRSIGGMQHTSDRLRCEGKRIAVVPTMGYLHEGHLTLIRAARKAADVVITTVFVNPAQFGPHEDFERYPRNPEGDISLASNAGSDFVFLPDRSDVYPEGYRTYVNVETLSEVLEGKFRPGHFRGVATIVAKLFAITKPHVAVFGQKDAQQVVVVRRMVQDLNFDIELIVVPTVREADGLALSSRNVYLSPSQRTEAPVLYRSLLLAERRLAEPGALPSDVIKEMSSLISNTSSGVIDYISVADANTLEELHRIEKGRTILVSLAVRFGTTRLIDNILVSP